jgi:hypothetical protein
MTVASIKRGRDLRLIVIGGGELTYVGSIYADRLDHVLVTSLNSARQASLAQLRRELSLLRNRVPKARDIGLEERSYQREARVWVGLFQISEPQLKERLAEDRAWVGRSDFRTPPTSPSLFLDEDRLRVRIEIWREGRPERREVEAVLGPFLRRQGAAGQVWVDEVPDYEGGGYHLSVDIDRDYPRGATVHDAWKLGDEAQALIGAADGEDLPREVAVDLLCGGRFDLFIGQPENDWLEAKGDPYDHLIPNLGENWRYELAKDVAAFANSPEGGVIVLGMTTKDDGDGDIIRGRKEFNLARVRASTYKKHIAQLVYPRIRGFEVKRVEGPSKGVGLAVLLIPAQPESSRPFVVQGVLSDRRVIGSHVLLPVRRQDETAFLDAGAVHVRLRLGERVIEGDSGLEDSHH